MGKTLMALITAALLSTSSLVMAASVADDMETIAEHYGKVLKADSTAVIKQDLQAMQWPQWMHKGHSHKIEE